MDNFGGIDWSGSGWSSKEVLNEIHSIPEVKPPPKYSTTRAQPRNPNNLNNIIEGDFHYHNNIENVDHSPENSVEVDDFYYDYNFINFHEDLSDDFENNGEDSGDSHRSNSPQEAKPTRSVKENAYMETTRAPTDLSSIFTISKTTAYTLKTEEPVNKNVDNMKDNGATKESIQMNSENVDDFLSEDYLLPVSTTHSPPTSTTQHSQTPTERNDNLWWPENISTMPGLVLTSKESTQDVTWGGNGEEAENNNDSLIDEENHTEDVTATPKHAAPPPGLQTSINTIVATTMNPQETEKHDDHDYSYNIKSTPVPDIYADQEDEETPELLGSPTPQTINQDESVSEIPQTSSQSTLSPTAFTLEDFDMDRTNPNTVYATSQYSWDADLDLTTTSLPASEKSTPLPSPFLLISGNQEASSDSTSPTGTEIIPPTNLEGAPQPSPADFLPSLLKQIQTEPAFTERTGTDSTSKAPAVDLADFDYNEIVIPPMVRSSSNNNPGPSCQFPTNTVTSPQHSRRPVQHTESPKLAVPILPTHPPIPRSLPVPTSVHTSASTQVTTAGYWVTGNWSAVSLHYITLHPHILVLYLYCGTKHSCYFVSVCFYYADTASSFAPCTHLTEFFGDTF